MPEPKLIIVPPSHADAALTASAEFIANGIDVEHRVSSHLPPGMAYLIDPNQIITDIPWSWDEET